MRNPTIYPVLFYLIFNIYIPTYELKLDSHYEKSDVDYITRHEVSNELDCPANRVEAVEAGRQCSRRCRQDSPCENIRKQCLCDGLCGLSCIKPDLVCPDLPKIDHGQFTPTSTIFNTVVEYKCEHGYFLYGSETRKCQGDEEWSGIPAECSREPICLTPIQVNHARNPNDGIYRLNENVEYSCYPGYQAKGVPESTCKLVGHNRTEWSWTSLKFKCLPKSCGDPGQIENGRRIGDSFIIASSVNYTCNDGFEMVGQARRFCQSDNHWSGQAPRCEPVTCKPMDHLDNGKINYAYPLIYNSLVNYSCDYGFKLVGPAKRRCGPEGKLEGQIPICVEIDCGQIWPLHNGYIRGYSSKIGSKIEFRCMDGMDFVGSSKTSVCLESGSWSHQLPQCVAPCITPMIDKSLEIYIASDGVGSEIDRGNVTSTKVAPGYSVKHGTMLQVTCEKNFELDEQMTGDNVLQSPICNNGTWTSVPKCKPARCSEEFKGFKNGRMITISIDHGSRAYLRCLDGHKLVGPDETYCRNGKWSLTNSTCVEVHCGYPGSIEHGRVMLVGFTGSYEYKPYIKKIPTTRQISYECDAGFRLNDGAANGATCMNGQWKPDGLPSCVKE